MIKKIILSALILFCSAFAFSQFTITITGPATTPHEGETVEYLISYTNLPFPRKLSASVVNGTIESQNLIPSTPPQKLYVRVRWNCNVINGSVTVQESITGVSFTLNTAILSFLTDPVCSGITPVKQNLHFNETPARLYLNCTPCVSNVFTDITPYSYQWQVGNVSIGTFPQVPTTWTDIPSATSADYQPPSYALECIKAYRRLTTFPHPVTGVSVTMQSSIAVISTFDLLNGGTINGGILFNNGVPIISQTSATGGLCDGFNYVYSWELSTDQVNWMTIGSTINYPATVQIPGSCTIRRKVICNGETAYTNALNINPIPLNPGAITGTGIYAFNTFPTVTQTSASGSACNPPDYIYTWERSVNNGSTWVTFGSSGINYPTGENVIGNCLIRRKVHCVFEDAYTTPISITMIPYISPNIEENLNYVRTNDIVIPSVQSWEQADALATGKKLQNTNYLDDFGRIIQSVVKQGSYIPSATGIDPANNINNYQDLVTHFSFDGLGRADKNYLPYATTTNLGFFKTNAAAEQQSFTNQKYGEPANSIYTYSQITYDGSPLNKEINVKEPGHALNSDQSYKGISSDYDFNKQTDNIHIWDIGFNSGDMPINSGIYGDNLLTKSITRDEKDKLSITYTDFSGNVILKRVQEANIVNDNSYTGWLSTYYVYDYFGRLRYTITPKAVAIMAQANSWVLDQDLIKGLCFYQEYDNLGRVIVKHSADGGEIWMVYDNRNRLVLTQDENQRNRNILIPSKANQWSFSLYDENDRVVSTGLVDDPRNRINMQIMVDGLSINAQNRQLSVMLGTTSENVTVYNPVVGSFPGSTSTSIFINSLSFYDDYSHRPANHASTSLTTNDFAPINNNNYIEQPVISLARMRGMATVSKNRILDEKYDNGNVNDERFLTSTNYYDSKGRMVQSYSDNIMTGVNVSAVLYDFSGKVLSTRGKHSMPGNFFNNTIVVTKNDYDLLGRAKQLSKLYTLNPADISISGNYKKLSEATLDEFGRIKTKAIGDDPDQPGKALETMDYSFNIQKRLIGINKDYALANGSMNDQWTRRFGFYLGYENGDNKFTNPQYGGSITGVIWRSQGDNALRKYDYVYDNVNRLKAANFTQKENPTTVNWSTNLVDVSASISGYDANGNLRGMIQKGIIPGTNGGIILDDLVYNYYVDNNNIEKSNKLLNITDAANSAYSGKQNDFKDYVSGNDYDYDFNGNLKYDKNKKIIDNSSNQTDNSPKAGIISNFLDLPQTITIKDKSITEYTYDATGTKLSKKVTQLKPGATPVITWYIGGFIYEESTPLGTSTPTTDLQYILNEEGKLRIIDQVNAWSPPSQQVNYLSNTGNVQFPNTTKSGVWDYYLKDNLGNTRMVLTEEIHQQQMLCSMETLPVTNPPTPDPRKDEEEATFGNSTNNEVSQTRYQTPSNFPWQPSTNVSRLIYTNPGITPATTIGPNVILKVMAGDIITGTAKYYYQSTSPSSNNSGIISNIANSLFGFLQNPGNVNTTIKDNITSTFLSSNGGPIQPFLNNYNPTPASLNTPKAFLNVIFFDEQFRYVGECSDAIPVQQLTGGQTSISGNLPPLSKKAAKNGYVYVYLSNESSNIPVYFDDFNVIHNRGRIIEDNSYYPFGLKIEGLSARAAKKAKSRQSYQGEYSEQDEESGYNEFNLRTYDPQIGRWLQVDPKDVEPGMYNGMGNDPVNQVDPDGAKWVKYMIKVAGKLVKRVQFFRSAIDQATAKEAVEEIGGTDAEFMGDDGFWTSNDNGIEHWVLNANGKATKVVLNLENLVVLDKGLCHPDNTYLQIENARIALEYSKLDFAHGQVDFPRWGITQLIFGERSFTGRNPVTNQLYINVALDKNGYVTGHQVPVQGTVDIGMGRISSLKTLVTAEDKLLLNIAQRAEKSIPGEGRLVGIARHQYTQAFIDRYQGLFKNLGLETELSQGASRLDVFKRSTGEIWDFKFYKSGAAPMSAATLEKYIREFNPTSIKTVSPKTGVHVKL